MNRVVITGMGLITPLGLNVADSWDAILHSQSGVGPITLFDVSNSPVKYAAEIKNFDPKSVLDNREVRRQDRFQWLADVAAQEAIQASGLQIDDANRDDIGVAVSSGAGGLNSMDEAFATLFEQGPRGLNPFAIPKIMSNGASGVISIKYGVRGPSFSVASACASGADGIGLATQMIRAGIVNTMIAGGAEAPITALTVGAFDRIGAASHRSDGAPSPFSANRDGLVIGEGSGVLVLEELDHAKQRGASILAEIVGYGASADAFHITAPTEDGSGSANAIRRALKDGRVSPDEIDYVNAHGTGTALNDESETLALKLALGNRAREIAVSSTKSMTGHMMGGTGAVEAVFCVLAIRDKVAPPTINFTSKDEKCDLDYVPNSPRDMKIRTAMSNSFGFGGHNSVLIIRAYDN